MFGMIKHDELLQKHFIFAGTFEMSERASPFMRNRPRDISAENWKMECGESHDVRVPKNIDPCPDAAVYCWVARADATVTGTIKYVGKAGKGVRKRHGQHQNGFTGSSAGLKNARLLRAAFRDGYQVELWFRKATKAEVFGLGVTLQSVEEEALIEHLQPEWNVNGCRKFDGTLL
ncbi:hypothetical protein [Sphingobium sp. SA916]|uniref:hypothetical protein n=1 Tax=Sphingobium sp. SA916 TaxID=1851207 RepID=UPI000C9F4E7B|nr:hypothetical protein [Sphingobium sp. SA916]PNP99499.1 hypothetical protein A8G00_04805 [Sphingobium sp. SA916]